MRIDIPQELPRRQDDNPGSSQPDERAAARKLPETPILRHVKSQAQRADSRWALPRSKRPQTEPSRDVPRKRRRPEPSADTRVRRERPAILWASSCGPKKNSS
jgi:hypothetical protein